MALIQNSPIMHNTNCNLLQWLQRLRRYGPAAAAISLCMNVGCHAWQKSHEAAVSHFSSGEIEVSREALEKSQKAFHAEKNLLELEQGILDLASGDVKHAEGRFRTMRRELEHLEQPDVAEQTASMMTDSRAVAFSGRDFERRMVLNLALLTSILGNGQDSFAYTTQVTTAAADRKEALAAAASHSENSANIANIDKPADDVGRARISPASFSATASAGDPASMAGQSSTAVIVASPLDQPLALSAYLAAAVQSETPTRLEHTERALDDIGFWNPAFHRHNATASQGKFGTLCGRGNGTLHIIALVGKAPRWVSEPAEPTSAALLIADRIISITGKHTLPPTIAAVKIARPEPSPSVLPRGSLRCSVASAANSEPAAAPASTLIFSTAVDLNEVAMASYHEHRDEELAAAVARRVLKKGAIYVLKETQNIHRNSWVDLGVNVAGVVWESLEKPDTRSWRMLPARIDIAHTELPAGDWTTTLNLSSYGGAGSSQVVPVRIEDGRNTFVVCIIPEHRLTGHILVGGADRTTIPVK